MSKMADNKTKALIWDAKMERKYGDPIGRFIADEDPSVRPTYHAWRDLNRELYYRKTKNYTELFIAMGILAVAPFFYTNIVLWGIGAGFTVLANVEVVKIGKLNARKEALWARIWDTANSRVKARALAKIEDEKEKGGDDDCN